MNFYRNHIFENMGSNFFSMEVPVDNYSHDCVIGLHVIFTIDL